MHFTDGGRYLSLKNMTRKMLIGIMLACLVCPLLFVWGESTYSQSISTAVTNIVANSTNTGNGSTFLIYSPKVNVRLFLTANGVAATTNGSLVVKFSTGDGDEGTTNQFDTAQNSNIKLTMSSLGGSTNVVSDWFVLSGVRYIRVGQIENTFNGACSNIVVRISYPTGGR